MLSEFQIGDAVGDYQIIGVLGRGGMGQVFQVRNRLSDRVEAMKVILPGHEDDPDVAGRFLREIKLLAGLEHPNIAVLRTALQAGNRILMIMEFVDGVNLQDKLGGGPLPLAEAVDCARQVLGALAFAHARGVIHRDVKPPNILMTAGGLVKLTDFGIARSMDGDGTLTGAGMAIGSLSYMSPEQVQGGDGGCALGPLFARRHPLRGSHRKAALRGRERVRRHARATGRRARPALSMEPGRSPGARRRDSESHVPGSGTALSDGGEFERALAALGTAEMAITAVASTLSAGFDPRRPGPAGNEPAPRTGAHLAAPGRQDRARLLDFGTTAPTPGRADPGILRARGFPAALPDRNHHRSAAAPDRGSGNRARVGSRVIETLKRKLAAYLGPIAPVVVARQARRARTIQELYQTLAAEIPSERDRKAFLASLQG